MLCAKHWFIQFRIVFSIYLQNFNVGQRFEQDSLANFKNYSKLAVYDIFVCSRYFAKAFLLGWWNRYARLCTWAEQLLGTFLSRFLLLLQWGGFSCKWASFRSLSWDKIPGYFVLHLISLENAYVLLCCSTHYTFCIIIYLKAMQIK